MADLPLRNATTSAELANPDEVSREQVINRWRDFRNRVHALYKEVETALQGESFRCDRSGKHTSSEELPQRVGVARDDLPGIDIFRIVRPDDTNAAVFYPRGLWIIGANGRIDLRFIPQVGGTETYILVDQSQPFTKSEWVRVPIGAPFDREPFDTRWLLSKLR
jgi:hypothetical protein